MNLYNKYRPSTFEEVVGNTETVEYLSLIFKTKMIPQSFLLHGETGCGKTTIARIMASELGCSKIDFLEINSANFRGIDTVRDLISRSKYYATQGDSRVWLIDEVHKMTSDAQNAMLKLLEDPTKNLYFILCTTEPQKLLPTIRGRCVELKVNPLSESQMINLLRTILKKEGVKMQVEVLEQIAMDSLGRPRNAIQILEKVIHLPASKIMNAIEQAVKEQADSIELCRSLLNGSPWKKVTGILKSLKGQDPEGIRRHVLAYAESALLKGDNEKAAHVIEEFMDPLYDVGFPGLVLYCYSVIKS